MKEEPDITVLQYHPYFHDHIGSAWVSLVIFIVLICVDIRLVSRLLMLINVTYNRLVLYIAMMLAVVCRGSDALC